MLPEELVITYLEMRTPPAAPGRPAPGPAEVRRVQHLSADFYRFLYTGVGRSWHWTDRAALEDESLLRLVTAPGVEVWVLYWKDSPAGYVEFELSPGEAKIAYFGLMPEFIGQGLGGFFLDWSVAQAWRSGVKRVWLHTCNLDHPAALSNYQKAGFSVFRTLSQANHHREMARFDHCNIVAQDWRTLADFYIRALGCREVPPPRDLSGPVLEAGTAVAGARLSGMHLRLPGGGPGGPTLEIDSYTPATPGSAAHAGTSGLRHLAFLVDDVEAVSARVRRYGAQPEGEIVTTAIDERRSVTWQYLRDPEGNLFELSRRYEKG